MASFGYGGDEENEKLTELKRLNSEVLEDPDSYERWERLVLFTYELDGQQGLHRNSNPQYIAAAREVFDQFLAKFPLFFGFWRKYAELEFAIAGTEAADMVWERGVASITNSVDLWIQYCAHKITTSHDPDVIRELFERGASSVGLDFLAHPFWDQYLDFESGDNDRVFALLSRIIHIPMHQYARYFDRYQKAVRQVRPVQDLAPSEVVAQFRAEIEMESGGAGTKSEEDVEGELRQRLDNYHTDIQNRTWDAVNRRWQYEEKIKRPYFHVTALDDVQLTNWREYLDFEEKNQDYERIVFLYERCLVATAYYDEFWLRYSRWMMAQQNKDEEVRNIFTRASCFYAAIARPTIRLHYALFEERLGRFDVAHAIYDGILVAFPGHTETIIAWINSARRQSGLDAAISVCKDQIESTQDAATKAALVAEWARLLWKVKGSPAEARDIFASSQQNFLDSQTFWASYLAFELSQPTSAASESEQYTRIKEVFETIKEKSQLSQAVVKVLAQQYMSHLLERGGEGVAKEYLNLDVELNGPRAAQTSGPSLLLDSEQAKGGEIGGQ